MNKLIQELLGTPETGVTTTQQGVTPEKQGVIPEKQGVTSEEPKLPVANTETNPLNRYSVNNPLSRLLFCITQ
jgi:hypothetical protein